ncbi:MAG: hypothetical protein ACYC8T_26745 [Myxococcaceae bacterium]
MLALTLTLVAPCLLGQVHGAWTAGVRAEARARPAFVAGPGDSPVAADAEVAPQASLALSRGSWVLFAEYAPLLRLSEPYAGGDASLLHTAALSGEWKPNPVDRVVALTRASYGYTDFLEPVSLTSEGPQPVQPGTLRVEPAPRIAAARTVEASAVLGADLALSPRVRLGLSGGYLVGGALEPEARELLPLRQGPELRVQLNADATRVDVLESGLWATYAAFSNGSTAGVLELHERWLHRVSEHTDGALSVGASGIRATAPGQLPRLDAVPVGSASLSHRVPLRKQLVELALSGGVVPFVDRFAGTAYLRAESLGAVLWTLDETLHLGVRGGTAYNITGGSQAGDNSAVLDLTATYDLDRAPVPRWKVDGFLHGQWSQARAGAFGFQWGAGVAFTVRQSGYF